VFFLNTVISSVVNILMQAFCCRWRSSCFVWSGRSKRM